MRYLHLHQALIMLIEISSTFGENINADKYIEVERLLGDLYIYSAQYH